MLNSEEYISKTINMNQDSPEYTDNSIGGGKEHNHPNYHNQHNGPYSSHQ